MPDLLLSQVSALTAQGFLWSLLASLGAGLIIAAAYMFRNAYTKGFAMTLVLLPAMVQVVIAMVNGNLGAGVAVMGAFSLVRFRSVPGSARDIASIFLAMAVGLAAGMGYLALALTIAAVLSIASLLLVVSPFGEPRRAERELKITIPESLDYTGAFDDLFERYTGKRELMSVRTTNMGSLYRLHYRVTLKAPAEEKRFIDELRCRNGNLEISCGRVTTAHEEL